MVYYSTSMIDLVTLAQDMLPGDHLDFLWFFHGPIVGKYNTTGQPLDLRAQAHPLLVRLALLPNLSAQAHPLLVRLALLPNLSAQAHPLLVRLALLSNIGGYSPFLVWHLHCFSEAAGFAVLPTPTFSILSV